MPTKMPTGYAVKRIECLCEPGDEWGPSVMEYILETPQGSLLICAQDDRAVFLLAMPGCSPELKQKVFHLLSDENEDGLSFTQDTNSLSFAKTLATRLSTEV